MTRMFHHCLASPPIASASRHVEQNVGHEALEFDQEGVMLKNLEGEGVIEPAECWAESCKMVRTLEDAEGGFDGTRASTC
jgi:hypothetical protein